MMPFRARVLTIAIVALAAVACGGSTPTEPPAGTTKAGPAITYPGPRFPSYLKPPSTIDEIMPYVRPIARNKSGYQGGGLGLADPGETVLIVASDDGEPLIIDAVQKAMEERGVQVVVRREYEMAGLTKAEADELKRARQGYTAEAGYMEAANWVEWVFPDQDAAKGWLKAQRPDLHEKLFPATREMTPRQRAMADRYQGENLGKAIREYLEKNPKVRGVYWGIGGGTFLRRYLHPAETKFLGLFIYDNRWDVMGRVGTYPGDVWQLAEDQTMEPIAYVDKLEITDPEGTNVSAEMSETVAQNWARGVYQRGHLYMFPNQATGRFGYSVVDYPAFQGEWLPREPMAMANGVIAGTTNHTGFFPRWEVVLKDGYVREVKGGGIYGDAFRTFLRFPNINDVVFPFHEQNHPGYWWLYEVAVGTHPKAFRNPAALDRGSVIPERQRDGVIHWGLGVTLHHDPGMPTRSQKLLDFTAQYNLPRDHGMHTHTYFATYRLHLRNANQWVNVLDKGRLTSLDNSEVRALASRYGDPDELLTEDWRPDMPGINEPGDYAQYAADPWRFVRGAMDQVLAGTYPSFYPPAKAGQ